MKAVILAGGFGKRLKPLTDERPKPLIEINDKPIVELQLEWLKSHGVQEVVLCVGFMKEKIIGFLGNGKRFGAKISYVVEEEPLGTGGALLNAEPILKAEDSFLVLNGDILTNLDPAPLISSIDDFIGAIALVPLKSPYGVVDVDEDGRIARFIEKPLITDYWVNAGIYCLTPRIFPYLSEKCSLETDAFPRMVEAGALKAIRYHRCFWKSIDVHKDIEEAAVALRKEGFPTPKAGVGYLR